MSPVNFRRLFTLSLQPSKPAEESENPGLGAFSHREDRAEARAALRRIERSAVRGPGVGAGAVVSQRRHHTILRFASYGGCFHATV